MRSAQSVPKPEFACFSLIPLEVRRKAARWNYDDSDRCPWGIILFILTGEGFYRPSAGVVIDVLHQKGYGGEILDRAYDSIASFMSRWDDPSESVDLFAVLGLPR